MTRSISQVGDRYVLAGLGTTDFDKALKNFAQAYSEIDDCEKTANKGQPDGYAGLDENGDLVGVLIPRTGTAAAINAIVLAQGELAVCTDTVQVRVGDGSTAGGMVVGGLRGESAISVSAIAAKTTNGTTLKAAYALAKTLTPYGSALSATNRATVLIEPGTYDFGTTGLTVDTQFIDLVGRSSNPYDTILTSTDSANVKGTIYHKKASGNANDSVIANLKIVSDLNSGSLSDASTDPAAYFPDDGLTGITLQNVVMVATYTTKAYAMRVGVAYPGTFTGCTSGNCSFGDEGGTASGTFTNCTGGNDSFGGRGSAETGGIASGTFTNCTGGIGSFGGTGGTASGTFTNCTGGADSFGGGTEGTAGGTFINCMGGNSSFGAGDGGTASGTFTNCTGGAYSFGGNGGTASGVFLRCQLGTATTLGVSSWEGTFSGLMEHCHWKVTGTNKSALKVTTGAKIHNCTLIGTGSGYSITAAGAVNIEWTQCRLNKGTHNVTNTATTMDAVGNVTVVDQ
jgi:hypothetical protein